MTSIDDRPDPRTLSFVADRRRVPGLPSRCFWNVTRKSGEADEVLGVRYAVEYLRYERADPGGPGILPWIVADMPRELGAVEIGFLATIGRSATFGLAGAERYLQEIIDDYRAQSGGRGLAAA